jgi:hypothetical protein
MRAISILIIVSIFALSCDSSLKKQVAKSTFNTVNAVLGDVSFEKLYGRSPNAADNYQSRIITHLQYVYHKLKSEGVESKSRNEVLQHLDDYITQAQFPKNKKYKDQTRPCFIDDEGNICAVGYLVEQTEGRAAAESINERYQYAFVDQMPDELIESWAIKWGLTKEECAMIQPQYIYGPYSFEYISFGLILGSYGATPLAFVGKGFNKFGIGLGIANIGFGSFMQIQQRRTSWPRGYNYYFKRNLLSGSLCIAANSFALHLRNKKDKEQNLSFNYSPIPTLSPSLAPFANGLRLSYRF